MLLKDEKILLEDLKGKPLGTLFITQANSMMDELINSLEFENIKFFICSY